METWHLIEYPESSIVRIKTKKKIKEWAQIGKCRYNTSNPNEDVLFHYSGSWMTLPKGYKILETVKVNDRDKLDYKKTSHYEDTVSDNKNKSLKYGWLSPDGEMFYCGHMGHISLANLLFDKSERELEHTGWVKIYAGDNSKPEFIRADGKRLTQRQTKYLTDNNFTVFEFDVSETY